MMEHRGNSLPQFLIDKIRSLRREGLSIRTLASVSGVARSTVEKYCRGLPVPSHPQRPPPEPPRVAVLAEPDGPSDEDLQAVEGFLDEYLGDD